MASSGHVKKAIALSLSLPFLLAPTCFAQSGVYTLSNASTTLIYTVTQDTGGSIFLASKHFAWPDLPFHADTGNGPRGTQQGYNLCNETTLGSKSWCQTSWLNTIEDFCLWGAPDSNTTVGDEEEELVAYCTNANHGSRVIPPGALHGVQLIKTPGYVEVVGYIDQTQLGFAATDTGGEEDPHGADNRGNPLGGLVYSSAFGSGIQQVTQWNYFIGSGVFCFKACDPNNATALGLCDNVYDLIGCTYNMPANYAQINGTFESCEGDDQEQVGTYTSNGAVLTFSQPSEGVEFTVPYTPVIPSSSQCSTYTSSNIFTDLANYFSSAGITSAPSTSGATSTATGTVATGSTVSAKGSSGAANAAGSDTSTSSSTNGARSGVFLGIAGVIGSVIAGALLVL